MCRSKRRVYVELWALRRIVTQAPTCGLAFRSMPRGSGMKEVAVARYPGADVRVSFPIDAEAFFGEEPGSRTARLRRE